MPTAMMYPEPGKGGRGQKSKITLNFSRPLLQQARTVLAYTPELANKVMVVIEPPSAA
jgi:hypothetical protein